MALLWRTLEKVLSLSTGLKFGLGGESYLYVCIELMQYVNRIPLIGFGFTPDLARAMLRRFLLGDL